MRIAYISMHPAPYRDAFISSMVKTAPFEVSVFSLFSCDVGHNFWNLESQDYDMKVLNLDKQSAIRSVLQLIHIFVVSKRYDFVLWPGWTYNFLFLPIFMAALLGRRYGFSADTVEQRKIGWLALLVKKFIVKRAEIVLTPGKAAKKYFEQFFRKSPKAVLMGAYSLDGLYLEKEILRRRNNDRTAIRQRIGLSLETTVFLMVANMIPSRCYPITVDGFLQFAKRHRDVAFVIVGQGPDLEKMKDVAKHNDCIKVLPGCPFDEMLSLYAMADVYVHGGKEPASTALVIGSIARMPLISSLAVGCSVDVLVDGKSGVIVDDFKSPLSWKTGFENIFFNRQKWTDYGDFARELSRTLDVDVCVEEFVKVLSARERE